MRRPGPAGWHRLVPNGTLLRAAPGLLAPLTWPAVAAAVAFVLLIRPAAGVAALAGLRMPWPEKLAVAFFGIRGVASFYYLAFALGHTVFEDAALLWAVVGLVVLISIVVHGLTAVPTMRRLEAET